MLLVDWQIRNLSLYGCLGHRHIYARKVTPSPNFEPMIDPFSEGVSGGGVVSYGLTTAGYDLRLGGEVWHFKNTYGEVMDPRSFDDQEYRRRVFDEVSYQWGAGVLISPHSYVLGHSFEYLRMPKTLKGRCVGKSTLARVGVVINTTPLEPGWEGHLTIEIGNISPSPVRLRVGEGIAQLEFEQLSGNPEVDYSDKKGKYQGQRGVTPARVV